jgi:hypothetical protein
MSVEQQTVPMDTTPAIWSLASEEEKREFVRLIGLDVFYQYADEQGRRKLTRFLEQQKQSNKQMR